MNLLRAVNLVGAVHLLRAVKMVGGPRPRHRARTPLPPDELAWVSWRWLAQVFVVLAASLLALTTAGAIAVTSSTQSELTTTTAQAAAPDRTRAVPADDPLTLTVARARGQDTNDEQPAGSLSAYGRAAAQAADNPVRVALDEQLVAQLTAQQRLSLEALADAGARTSREAIDSVRATSLADAAATTRREQARLEEEKRKAEEALRLAQEAEARRWEQAADPGAPLPALTAPTDPAGSASTGGAAHTGLLVPQGPAPATGRAVRPLDAYTLGSRWGAVGSWSRYHTGQDLAAPIGTPVRAVADGVVTSPVAGGWAGTHAIIRHPDGSSLYAHLSATTVQPGQPVVAGQVIGYVGMTGRTFGPHLHLEHYPIGAGLTDPYRTDDPYAWLLRREVRL